MKRINLLLALAMIQMGAGLNTARADSIDLIGDKDADVQVRLNQGEAVLRYNLTTDDNGTRKTDTLQDRELLDVTISFFRGFVRVDFTGMSGSTFQGSFNNVGYPAGVEKHEFDLRRLSMTLSPITGLAVSAGSFGAEYGAGSENTYLDNDGYIMGYRAKATIEDSQLVVTGGYLGDFKTPDVFDRLDRMNEFNYLQIALTQSIAKIIKGSLEYNRIDTSDFLRAAATIDVRQWVPFIDSLVIEDTMRVSDANANIFAAKITKRFKDVLGDFLAGRDLVASLMYNYSSDQIKLPIGDKVFQGNSVRMTLTVPNLFKVGPVDVGTFVDYIQSFDDFDHFRAECGLSVKL